MTQFASFRQRLRIAQSLTPDSFCAKLVRVDALAVAADRDRKRIGRRIVEAREAAGMNQRELAERLVRRRKNGIAEASGEWHRCVVSMQRNLRRHENGHNSPRADVLIAIADETGTDLAHFAGDDDEDDSEQAMRRIAADLVLRGHDDLAVDLLHVARRVANERIDGALADVEPAATPSLARDGLQTGGEGT